MMASNMQIDGLISGLSTGDIISSMMAAERRPLLALQRKQAVLEGHGAAIRNVAAKLSSLKSAIDALGRLSTFNPRRVTIDTPSTQPAAVIATANADSAIGSFKLTIGKLATSTQIEGAAALGEPISTTATLDKAGFALTPTDGFLTVNGVRFDVDADVTTLDALATTINASGAGVKAEIQNNRLVLGSDSAIKLGSGADTSNFLTSAKLLAAPAGGPGVVGGTNFGYTVTSTGNVGVAQTSASLSEARLATALTDQSGAFKINGVEIAWDAANDSINRVISRINASSAGVTAAYDSQTDKLSFTAKATGSMAISVEDVTGNFLAATGTLNGTVKSGQNAEYSIDTVNGGQTLYSASNTISGVVPGVTLNLKSETATPVTVSVEQENAPIVEAVKSFIDQYNAAVSYIRDQSKWDATAKKGGPLLASSEVRSIESRLRQLITGNVSGAVGKYTSLASIGVSTGAIGSGVGTTNALVLDEAKLSAALADNPAAVSRLFVPPDPVVGLQDGGTGSIASVTRSPTTNPRTGKYVITADAAGNLSSVFTPTGGSAQTAVTGTIAAGGSNSTLLSGLVLNARDPFVAGTDTILVTPGDSVSGRLASYLDSLISSSTGSLTNSGKSDQDEITRLGKQIAAKEDLLVEKEARLQARFTALEVVLARLQAQAGQSAAAMAGLLSNNSQE